MAPDRHETTPTMWGTLRALYQEWNRDNAMMLAAAVAFYATFSLAPLVILLLNAGALLFGADAARARVVDLAEDAAGARAARALHNIIMAALDTEAGVTILSIAALLLAASAMFRQLKAALNLVLDVPTKEEGGLLRYLRNRLVAAVFVVAVILLLLTALGATAAIDWLRRSIPEWPVGDTAIWRAVELLLLFSLLTLIFGAILKFVPDMRLRWRHVGVAAASAAALFVAGQLLISVYLRYSNLTTAYGAAGSIVLLLLYIYFAVSIILAAAELTEILSSRDAEFQREREKRQHDGAYTPRKQASAATPREQ